MKQHYPFICKHCQYTLLMPRSGDDVERGQVLVQVHDVPGVQTRGEGHGEASATSGSNLYPAAALGRRLGRWPASSLNPTALSRDVIDV
jgi:hypothetical protein